MNKLDDIKRRYAELRRLFLANGISIKDFNESCRRLNDEFEEAMGGDDGQINSTHWNLKR